MDYEDRIPRWILVAVVCLAACGNEMPPDGGGMDDHLTRDLAARADGAPDGLVDLAGLEAGAMDLAEMVDLAMVDVAMIPPDLAMRVDLAMPANCMNNARDGDESDVDCGGSCKPCGDGKRCIGGADCASGACLNNLCKAPACNDTLKNGSETDVDCGGQMCPKCANGKMCMAAADCASNFCMGNVCATLPTCNDMLKNGMETDVDCGGQGMNPCPKCANAKACAAASDCVSNLCMGNVCQAVVSCNDNLKNGMETDVDCGGQGMAPCPKCANGRMCAANGDCVGGQCMNNTCAGGPMLTLAFTPPLLVPLGLGILGDPVKVVVGYLDQDGILDFAVSNDSEFPPDVAVLLGKGGRQFAAPRKYTVGSKARGIAAGDLNGDGRSDLAVSLVGGTGIGIGNGDGTFKAPATTLPANADARGPLRLVDLNGDGKLDIVKTRMAASELVVALGKGDGTFLPATVYAVDKVPSDVVVADLNGDKKLDLVVTGWTVDIASVYRGKGDGTFEMPTRISPGKFPKAVTVGEVNGDGKLDLVFAVQGGLSMMWGNGDGTFKAPIVFATRQNAAAPRVVDFNLDGKQDAAVAVAQPGGVTILVNKGNGLFAAELELTPFANWPDASVDLAVADLDGDNKPDIVAIDYGKPDAAVFFNASK